MRRIERSRHPLAVLITVLTIAAVLAAAVSGIHLERAGVGDELGEWVVVLFAPGFLLSGWWLTTHRPRMVLGWLLLTAALTVALAGLAAALAGAALADGRGGVDWWLWVFSWLWQPHSMLLGITFLLFPDGVARTRWQRGLVIALAALCVGSMFCSALLPGPIITTPDQLDGTLPGVTNPVGIALFEPVADGLFVVFNGLGFLATIVPLVWTATKWRRAAGVRRRQFRWVTLLQLGWLIAIPLVLSVPGLAGGTLAIAQTLIVQALLVVAISQWQAFDVDVVIRRSVLAGTTLAAGLAVYAAVVAFVSFAIADDGAGIWPTTTGAAVAIVSLGPLSVLIRRGVNRVFYGRRDDPYAVVTETSRRLTGAADPTDGIAATLRSLTDQLRIPYAAVADVDGIIVSASGRALHGDEPAQIPIRHHGGPRGTLLAGHRRGTATMTFREVRLLDDIAVQLGPALAAVEQVEGLRAAQRALVAARDDERLRIQRDLHDGLGSVMTGITLKLAAATNHLGRAETAAAGPLVQEARVDIERALLDIRRLVYSLGDPAASTRRLADVLAEDIAHIAGSTDLHVTLNLAGVPDLPADTAEQVRRIVGEAVTNVVRHAEARNCAVRACVTEDRIEIVVQDDGLGVSDRPAGVGRRTMAKRAEQLGATLQVFGCAGKGTTVSFTLPSGAPR